jgi:hypothetical protein
MNETKCATYIISSIGSLVVTDSSFVRVWNIYKTDNNVIVKECLDREYLSLCRCVRRAVTTLLPKTEDETDVCCHYYFSAILTAACLLYITYLLIHTLTDAAIRWT